MPAATMTTGVTLQGWGTYDGVTNGRNMAPLRRDSIKEKTIGVNSKYIKPTH